MNEEQKQEKPIVFIGDDVLYLRPVEQSDAPRMQRWINDPAVRHFLAMYLPMNSDGERKYVEKMYQSTDGFPTNLSLAIVLREGDRHIGSVALHEINWKHRFATTGSLIGEIDCLGKGYGSRAKTLLLRYTFAELGMHKVKSRVYAYNLRSQGALKKNGYVQEGLSRSEFFRDGVYHDILEFGILAEEFAPIWEKYLADNKKEAAKKEK